MFTQQEENQVAELEFNIPSENFFRVERVTYPTVDAVSEILCFLESKNYEESLSNIHNLIKNHMVFVARGKESELLGVVGAYKSFDKTEIGLFELVDKDNSLMQKGLLNALLFSYTDKQPLEMVVSAVSGSAQLRKTLLRRGFNLVSTSVLGDGFYEYSGNAVVTR